MDLALNVPSTLAIVISGFVFVVPVLRYQDAGTPGANQSNHSIGRILSMSTRERRNQLVPGSVS